MNIKKRQERDKDIMKYLEFPDGTSKHTLSEAGFKFDLSQNQVFRIRKRERAKRNLAKMIEINLMEDQSAT